MRAPNRVRLPQGTALALCLSMFSGSVALAADAIALRPGFSELIGPSILPRPVGQIFVGNADVVDVTLQNDRQIVITAKKVPGATNLIILDRQNNEMFRADIAVVGGGEVPNKVQVHTKGRQNLHHYWAYTCPPGKICERLEDKLEEAGRGGEQTQSRSESETTTTRSGESGGSSTTRGTTTTAPSQ